MHGSESPKLVEKITGEGIFVIKALFAAKAPLLNQYEAYEHASCILVEYGKGILPGGNAETWDYEQSSSLNQKVKLILAGGLHPGNVHDAVTRVNPFGVDVSSGVEKIPGVKDMHKVTAFIDRLRKNKISGANVQ